MLKALERGNLFVVPLDDKRQWYRYHHLFADVLHTRLVEEWPNRVPGLHRRASAWYERNGSPPDAVRHALAAEDFERVADLAELAWPAMKSRFQSTTWLDWVKKLPDELIRTRPVLSTQYAWALWLGGELEASEARLRDAERWLDPTGDMSARPEGSSGGMVVVDKERFRTLPASIALTRAYNALAQGDVSSVVKYAELALKLTPDEDHLGRANATVTLGLACWASGDLEAAQRAMADWIDSTRKAGNIVSVVACTFGLADIMVARGRLHEAVRAYKRSLRLASEHDKNVQRVIAHSHLGLAMLYHEMGDQEAAAQRLLKSEELGQRSTLPDWPSRWCVAQAQLKEAGGDLEAALDLLDEAKRVYVRVAVPDIRPIEALKARVYVRQGELPKALAWARERGLSVDDELSYLGEFEHIILARVLIAEYKSDRAERSVLQAIGLLERLLKAAEEGRRMGSVIDILALRALAHQARGDIPLALAALERALTLAEPEGYVRIFVDEGPPMEALLKKMRLEDGRMRKYVYKLLAAFSDKESPPPSPSPQPLIDPLSKRECEVLKLLTTELSGPEIAKELMVSMNTIRTHTKNIYSKLGVNSRRDAVRQAKELKLI
jgi:LuxR family maltose regulon positive regulatory protein